MKITEMIMEWRKGCSCCEGRPINCNECTLELILAIDKKALLDECMGMSEKLINEHGIYGISMGAVSGTLAIKEHQAEILAINKQSKDWGDE